MKYKTWLNNIHLKALAKESKLKQVDRRISANATTILIILNEMLTLNTVVTVQQSSNVYNSVPSLHLNHLGINRKK